MTEAGAGGRIGGVRALDLKDVQVSGATAKVRAEVTVWFKTAQVWDQSVTSRPEATNIIDLDLQLIKDAGTWKMDREDSQFAPGGGPCRWSIATGCGGTRRPRGPRARN